MALESAKSFKLSGILRKEIVSPGQAAESTIPIAPETHISTAVVDVANTLGLSSAVTLGQGIAASIYSPVILKEQKELDVIDERMQSVLFKELQKSRVDGDVDREKRLIKMMQSISDSPSLVEQFVDADPTNTQILAAGSELVLWTLAAYNPALSSVKTITRYPWLTRGEVKTMNQIKKILDKSKLADSTFIQKTLIKAQPLLKEAAFGSAFFMAIKAQEEDATADDIIQAGEIGAFIPPALIVGAKGLASGLKITSKHFRNALNHLEQKASDFLLKGIDAGDGVEAEVLGTIGGKKNIKTITAESFLKGVQASRQFTSRFIDRSSGLKRFEDLLIDVKGGIPLTEKEKIYRDVRLLDAFSLAKAEEMSVELLDKLRPYNDILDTKAKSYITLMDYLERAKMGLETPMGKDVKVLTQKLKSLIGEIGDDMIRVGDVKKIVRDYQVKMLKIRRDAELISTAEMKRIMKAHKHYIPHDVIADIDERAINDASSGLSKESKRGLRKAVGSSRKIRDQLLVTLEHTPTIIKLAEKNKLLINMVEAQEKYKFIPGMKRFGGSRHKMPAGFEKISLFRKGIRETWIVPRDVAISIKNMDGIITPALFNSVTEVQQLLKAGATKYNLTFSIPNKFRDIQTAALTTEAFIDSMSKRYGVSPMGARYSQEEIKDLYRVSGGLGASIFEEGEQKMLASLEKKGISTYIKDYNPLALSQKINESLETSTRLNVFKKALNAGLSPKDAALVARDATIDFAKMGSWMQQANRAIPFLNARVQGFINIPRAFMENPEAFARTQLFTSVYPTLLLHSHNRRYESYKNISDYIKSRYWIIMIGETDAIDSGSGKKIKVPQFITIPKGEGQALTSIPIQFYLDRADQADYRKTSEMLADLIGNTTPISFQTFGSQNFAGSIASQLGPLVTVPIGLATNQNLFYGREIIPKNRVNAPTEMQFSRSTPESTKSLANIMGVAPSKLEFVLDSFGGLPQDTQRAVDITMGLFSKDDVIDKLKDASVSGTEFGASTQLPVLRSIIRESNEFYSPEMDYLRKQKENIVKESTGKKLSVSDYAEDVFRKMNSYDSEEDRLKYLYSLGDELTPDVLKKLEVMKTTRNTIEVLSTKDSVDVRAQYILWRIQDLKNRGVGYNDRLKYLNDLQKTKILTDDTLNRMDEIKLYGY